MYRIAYINHNKDVIYGAEKSLLLLLKNLDRQQFSPHLVLPAEGPVSEEARRLDIPTFSLPMQHFDQRYLVKYFTSIWNLFLLLKNEKIDLVHSNSLPSAQVAGWAARIARVPSVAHIREIYPFTHWRRWATQPNRFIAISEAVKNHLLESGYPHRRIEVVYNGIDLNDFFCDEDPKEIRERFKIPPGPVVGVVGQIIQRKNHITLLNAAAKISPEFPDLQFLVIGNEPKGLETYTKRLKEHAREKGIESRMHWLGYQKDTRPFYKIMDALVVPSLQEPFGRVLLEAMAMGKPVIASRVGGMPEIVSDGECGRLFAAKNANALANALREVLNSPGLAQRWGKAGRKRCERLFSIQANVAKTEGIYCKMLKEQGPQT